MAPIKVNRSLGRSSALGPIPAELKGPAMYSLGVCIIATSMGLPTDYGIALFIALIFSFYVLFGRNPWKFLADILYRPIKLIRKPRRPRHYVPSELDR